MSSPRESQYIEPRTFLVPIDRGQVYACLQIDIRIEGVEELEKALALIKEAGLAAMVAKLESDRRGVTDRAKIQVREEQADEDKR